MKKRLKDIGEFGWIREIQKKIRVDASVVKGIGDDAAVLTSKSGEEILLTTDMLVEDRHFRLGGRGAIPATNRSGSAEKFGGNCAPTPYQIGRKALAVNISDIAAMGGLPRHAVIAIAAPPALPVAFMRELYRGIGDLARNFKVNIVGGDTSASEKIIISIALTGTCPKGRAIFRSGARVGDNIFVTGALGGSYASKKHLNFVPRVREAQFLVKNFKIHAMMDISDGLASDIHRIAEASGVGAQLWADKIPVSSDAKGLEGALTDGEDFELLFTASPKEKIAGFYCVGKIVNKKKGVTIVDANGKAKPLREKGFDHFK